MFEWDTSSELYKVYVHYHYVNDDTCVIVFILTSISINEVGNNCIIRFVYWVLVCLCKYYKDNPSCILFCRYEVSMVRCPTYIAVLPETECRNSIFHIKGYLILLEILGLLMIISKYFSILMVIFCSVVGMVNNIMYFVILGRVLLVFFVITMLMGSLTNFIVPLIIFNLRYVRGLIFILIIFVLVLM